MTLEVMSEQALLARLAYLDVDFGAADTANGVIVGLPDELEIVQAYMTDARLKLGFPVSTTPTGEPPAPVASPLDEWKPVASFGGALDVSNTGLEATVFKNTSGVYTVAVRGTLGSLDVLQDVFLAAGLPANATAQFNALTGWLDQLSAPGGELAGKQVNFTGHSLGGYLAAAAHTHYQSEGSMTVGTSYLFNAPGIGGVIGSVVEFFQDVLGTDEPSGSGIVNVESSDGLRVTSSLGLEPAEATVAQIQESSNPLIWHGIGPLSNTLLAASTFEAALGMSLTDYNRLVDSLPGGVGAAMSALLSASGAQNTAAPQSGNWASLAVAADAIAQNAQNISGYSFLGSGADWVSMAMEESAAGASVRAALEALSPVAYYSTVFPSSPDYRTPTYWAQRADMLSRLTWFGEHDINPYTTETPTTPDGSGAGLSTYQTDSTIFRDGSSGTTIQQGPDTPSMSRTLFGSTGTSTEIVGGGVGDFLFSSGGAEVLRGEYGADYLEGYGGGDQLIGGQGDDVLVGLTSADGRGYHFDGGTENDTISGSANGDTYTYRAGDGHDTIQEALDAAGANDSIRLQGVSVATTTFSLSGSNLFINMADGGSVEVVGWGSTGGDRGRIETLTFDDATLTADTVDAILAGSIVGTEGDNTLAVPAGANGTPVFGLGGADRLYGSNTASSWLYGGAGVDRLYAGTQGDFLDGGADGDYLTGGAGRDILLGGSGGDQLVGRINTDGSGDYFEGGTGVDVLYGTAGADEYVINAGDGVDYFHETSNAATHDILRLGGSGFRSYRAGKDLIVRNDNGDGAHIIGWYSTVDSTSGQVEEIIVGGVSYLAADLTAEGLKVQGSDTNASGSYNYTSETLTGLNGFRNELYGNGGSDRLVAGDQGDKLDGGADADYLIGGTGHDELYGGAGNDYLSGRVNADGSGDYFEGGAGGDSLHGTTGADRYVVNAGDGMDYITESGNTTAQDVLELNVGGTVSVTRNGTALVLRNEAGEGATLWNWYSHPGSTACQVEEVTGALNITAAELTAIGLIVQGSDTNASGSYNYTSETLTGVNGYMNELYGNGGSDRLVAGDQGDKLDGGADADYLIGGTGRDELYGGAGNDYLSGRVNADGSGDYFEGGAGGDSLHGTTGADRYVVNVGDGMDYLTESSNTTDVDTLELGGAGGTATRSGTSLIIRNSTGDGVTISNWFPASGPSTAYQVEVLHIGGATYTNAQINAMDFTNGPVTLSGGASASANAEALYTPQSFSESTDAQGLESSGDVLTAPLSASVDATAAEESAMLTEQMEASSDVGTAPETTITVDDDTSATTTVETPVYVPQEPQNFSLATV